MPTISGFLAHLGVTQKELWQSWSMRGTENPENVVQFHEVPLLTLLMANSNDNDIDEYVDTL